MKQPEPFLTGSAVAAFVAAGVALLMGVTTLLVQRRMARSQQDHQKQIAQLQLEHESRLRSLAQSFTMRQRDIDHRVTQLNELYGPLRMLRTTSNRLRQSLPKTDAKGAEWRLVKHIREAKRDAGMTIIVEAILAINKKIEDLLITKAGLMEAEHLPESLARFMHHSRLLQLAWQQGDDFVRADAGLTQVQDVAFPYEIDRDIEAAIGTITAALVAARTSGLQGEALAQGPADGFRMIGETDFTR